MKILYVCAKSFYFTEGYRGRVIHAKGVVEGLLANNSEVEIVSGPGISEYFDNHPNLSMSSIGNKKENLISEIMWRREVLFYVKERIEHFDLLIVRYGFSNPFFSIKIAHYAQINECKSVLEVNSLGTDNMDLPTFMHRIVTYIELMVLAKFNKIYVVSKQEKKRILDANSELNNVIVIPNATHKTSTAQNRSNGNVRFVYLGILQPYYNFEEIVTAFEEIQNQTKIKFELLIYGYGPNDTFLKDRAYKNPKIKLMGKYNNELIETLINRNSDILILPSKKDTSAEIISPIKLFEYMVLGAPILASDVGQIKNILQKGKTGYIYESNNSDDLKAKMMYLVNNKKERCRVGLNAHHEALESHSWKSRMGILLNSFNIDG